MTRSIRIVAVVALATAALGLPGSPAGAATKAGQSCKKIGQVSGALKCVKKGTKKVYAAIAPAATTAPATTATTAPATTATTKAGAATTAAATTAASTAPAVADPLGTKTAATGTPVKIGYVWSGVSAAIDNTEEFLAAQATFKYANDYLGGVAGHPIEVVPCATNEDAAIAADCGNQMVQKGVAAVLFNVNGQVSAWSKTVIAANIPIFAYASADATLLAPGVAAFTVSNPIAGLAAFPALLAKKNSFTKATVLVIDVPGATGPEKAIAPPTFAASGVPAVDIVPIAPGTADMSPDVQAALKTSPQLVHIIGNSAFCITAIKALRDASYKGTISMISNCLDASTIKSVGADLKGIQVSYSASEDPTDSDYATFKAILAKYAAGQKVTATASTPGSFSVVVGFARVMKGVTGDITPATVTAAIKAGPALPQPLIKGGTFKCDGKAVPGILPACTAEFVYATLDDKGAATNYTSSKA